MRLTLLIVISVLLAACSPGPQNEFQLAQKGLLSGALSEDSSYALIGSIHHGGSLWDIERNERLYSWNHQSGGFSSFRTVALSADGQVAVTTEEKSIGVWNATTGESKAFWEAADRILAIALSPDGDKALIGMRDGTLDYFNLRTGQVIQRMFHKAEVRSVALSADGKVGLSGSDDFTAISWNLGTGKEIQRLSLNNQIKTVALSSSGNLAFTSAQREGILLWDPMEGSVKTTIDARYTNYTSIDFSDDEKQLFLGASNGTLEQRSISSGDKLNHWQAKPRKTFGRASSKAIIAIRASKGKVVALTADGMVQTFSG